MLSNGGIEFFLEDSSGRTLPHSNPEEDAQTGKIFTNIEVENQMAFYARWRSTDRPLNVQCELFVPFSDEGEERATFCYMEEEERRTQSGTSKDKLNDPFTQYAMLRASQGGYVRLEVRRVKGAVEKEPSDDPETSHFTPWVCLEFRFQTPTVSPGRSKRRLHNSKEDEDSESAFGSSRYKKAKRARPHRAPGSQSDSDEDEPTDARTLIVSRTYVEPESLTDIVTCQLQLKEAEKKRNKAISLVKAKLTKIEQETALLEKFVGRC
ncbi:hypothetical protein B0H11DRAFT_2004768 [Mycena galericulata]|nr:hypothetical protein B0H11DRAFT_2004768 [Mycena galericulata]